VSIPRLIQYHPNAVRVKDTAIGNEELLGVSFRTLPAVALGGLVGNEDLSK
jgi:hypothetical protein